MTPKPAEPDEFPGCPREAQPTDARAALAPQPGPVRDERAWLQHHRETLLRELEEANRARQEAEAALRASEAQFASAFAHAAIGMALVSPGGRYLWANRALCEMFGYSEPELRGMTYDEVTHPDDRGDQGEVRRLLAGEIDSLHLEKRYLHRDGRIVWGRLDVSLLRDGAGAPMHTIAQVQDITERKRSEEETGRVLQRLNDAQRLGQIGDWEWSPTTESIVWSPQVFEIFGRDPSFGPPRNYEEYTHLFDPENRAILKASVAAAITSGETRTHELMLRRPDGRHVQLHGLVLPCRNEEDGGGVVSLHGTVQDITAARQTEEALRRSEALFRTLMQTSWEGFHLVGPTGRIIYESPAVTRLLGYRPEELVGRHAHEFVHPDDVAGMVAGNSALLQTPDQPLGLALRVRHKDGSWRCIECHEVNLLAHPDVGAIAVNFRDVTARKEAELEIQSLNADLEARVAQRTGELFTATQEAEKANLAKSEFLSRTSHELRTPLNAILGFGQLLEMAGRDPGEADSIEQILRAGRHLLGLINEMLDLSRIEAGQLEFTLQAWPLHETVAEALALVRPLATERGVTLDPFETHARVFVDAQRSKQVILNLLSNAVKYNRPGGRVTCAATEAGGGRLRFSVRDTGIGIAAADAGKVFTAFGRFGGAAAKVDGIGLGLAITRQLTELMDGRIGFDSVPGEGSTFWVEFPLADRVPPGAPSPGSAPAPTPGDAVKLLYIEDNVSNQRLVKQIVARRPNIEFLCAATGTLGLEIAREHRPDLILLDLYLPDLGGEDVLQRLAADPATAALPVVMLSADALPARRDQLLAAGLRAFLTKPIEVRALLTVLDDVLKR